MPSIDCIVYPEISKIKGALEEAKPYIAEDMFGCEYRGLSLVENQDLGASMVRAVPHCSLII